MEELFHRILGHERIMNAFGYWPNFHDSEILSIELIRVPDPDMPTVDAVCLKLKLHAFEWTRGTEGYFNHHLVEFQFGDVSDVQLAGFNHQNAIYSLGFQPLPQDLGLKIKIDGAHGVSGTFLANGCEILSLVPCDAKGIPSFK
jgi:hypothetical protein